MRCAIARILTLTLIMADLAGIFTIARLILGGKRLVDSLLHIVQNILSSAIPLVPVIVGIAVFIAGATLALGNHQRGKEGVIVALVGGAIMLSATSIGAGLTTAATAAHP